MSDLLVTIILSVCGFPEYGGTEKCHETIVNCAVLKHGEVTKESIEKCLEAHQKENQK